MSLSVDSSFCTKYIAPTELRLEIERGLELFEGLLNDPRQDNKNKGWIHCAESAIQIREILDKSKEIRKESDVFILVGVGGSNQAARAVIEALGRKEGPKILYAGNSLSAHYLRSILDDIEGHNIYIDVIAKNFETLEPASHYRILRSYMKKTYGETELARRTILTGSRGSRLEEIAEEHGNLFLEFPENVGGRYSAFTPVALLPMAVAGLDIDAYLRGALDMETKLMRVDKDNPAVIYAAIRNLLYRKGFRVEMLASFEPALRYFAKWWWQLFGESEGKDGKGIFPSMATYSEDLHSIGQYVQDGQRFLMETFISVETAAASVIVAPDPDMDDRLDYLDGGDFAKINKVAETSTIDAHAAGGVPCVKITIDRLDEYHFGQLFYFFMFACAVSGKLLGVNPFDQEGVEQYKRRMFKALGKPESP